MVKKMRSKAAQGDNTVSKTAAALLDNQIANAVKESAQQIWLAGMGAFKQAQEEGSKVFEALVKEGASLQKKTQGLAEDKIHEVTGKMSAMAGSVSAKAGQNWDKLEAIFEQRTAKALGKLGVPTALDVNALSQRVDALAAAVAQLHKAAPAKAAKAAKAAPKAAPAQAAKPAPKASVKARTRPAAKRPSRAAS